MSITQSITISSDRFGESDIAKANGWLNGSVIRAVVGGANGVLATLTKGGSLGEFHKGGLCERLDVTQVRETPKGSDPPDELAGSKIGEKKKWAANWVHANYLEPGTLQGASYTEACVSAVVVGDLMQFVDERHRHDRLSAESKHPAKLNEHLTIITDVFEHLG